ncbi:MAG: hypothetical protein RLY20_3305 [Verrucomicrobiota bacterium]|jgi:hypothetical protein
MRIFIPALSLVLLAAVSGCKSHPPQYADVLPPSKSVPAASTAKETKPKAAATPSPKPVIKPADVLSGKVVTYNVVGRFAVLNFPITRMPAIDQKMYAYREGLKVGEFKVTGPQQDDNIVADLVAGEARVGDEVRDH